MLLNCRLQLYDTICAYGFTGGSCTICIFKLGQLHNVSWVTVCMGYWVRGQCQWPIEFDCSAAGA